MSNIVKNVFRLIYQTTCDKKQVKKFAMKFTDFYVKV